MFITLLPCHAELSQGLSINLPMVWILLMWTVHWGVLLQEFGTDTFFFISADTLMVKSNVIFLLPAGLFSRAMVCAFYCWRRLCLLMHIFIKRVWLGFILQILASTNSHKDECAGWEHMIIQFSWYEVISIVKTRERERVMFMLLVDLFSRPRGYAIKVWLHDCCCWILVAFVVNYIMFCYFLSRARVYVVVYINR